MNLHLSSDRKMALYTLLALAMIVTFSSRLTAQLSTASIRGTIRDSSNAVVPGAKVVLRNLATGVELPTLSTGTGGYLFPNVQPGNYDLRVSKEGFVTQKTAEFDLQVNQSSTLNFVLPIGSTRQTVTVQAHAVALATATSGTGNVVTGSQVENLPINSKNLTNLLVLSPGVSTVNVSQVHTRAVGQMIKPSVNGSPNRSNLFLLDGASDNETFSNSFGILPSIDFVQQMKVQEHKDSAEFGGSMGATFNVVTKSGTNGYHGEASEYFQNNDLNARNPFLSTVPVFHQNQFSATIGGPVRIPKVYNGKNKTFFFLGYEGYRESTPGLHYYKLPTAAQLNGDFSAPGINPIYDPATTTLAANGTYVKTQFPGNIIPTNRINAGNLYYVKNVFPVGQSTDIIPNENYLASAPTATDQDNADGRIDENFSSKDSAFFRITTNQYRSFGGPAWDISTNRLHGYNWSASWLHVFGPTSVLQLQGGRTLVKVPSTAALANIPSDFINNINTTPDLLSFSNGMTLVPELSIASYSGTSIINHPATIANTYSIRGTYTKVIGRHTLMMGGDLNTLGADQANSWGQLQYGTDETALLSASGKTGDALASFMLGLPETVYHRDAPETLQWGGVMGFFFQDQWKVSDRFTANLGLRWDHTYIPPYGTAAAGNWYVGNLNFNNGTYEVEHLPSGLCSVVGHSPCLPSATLPAGVYVSPNGKIWNMGYKNFEPRIGLAYHLFHNTVLRGSFGIEDDSYAGVVQTTRQGGGTWPSTGFAVIQNLNEPTPTNLYPDVTPANLPGLSSLPLASPFVQSNGTWNTDPALTVPYSEQWNLGIQQALTPSTILTVNYVGGSDYKLIYGANEYNSAFTPGPGTPALRAPYPSINQNRWSYNGASSNYNALQVQVNRRVSKGLAMMVAYTFSKSIDEACSGWFGQEGCSNNGSNEQIYNIRASRSVSQMDLPSILTAAVTYQLPIGKGHWLSTKNGVLNYVIGNWQINSLMTFHSGLPYTIYLPGDIANIGATGYERPNLVGDPHLANPSEAEWFNTAAFATPAAFTYGNLGRNTIRGPWGHKIDMSLFRIFPIERAKLRFGIQAFQAFNNVQLGAPGVRMGAANFSKITSAANGRVVQLMGRITF